MVWSPQYVWKNSPWHLGGLSRHAHIPPVSWGYTGFNRAAKRGFLGRCVEALVAWSRGGSMEQWLLVEASESLLTWVRIPGPPLDLGPALQTN